MIQPKIWNITTKTKEEKNLTDYIVVGSFWIKMKGTQDENNYTCYSSVGLWSKYSEKVPSE